MCVLTAWQGCVEGTIAISSLQFLIAPYSFFVSVTLAIALAPPIYLSHYFTFYLIETLTSFLQTFIIPTSIVSAFSTISPYFDLPIGPKFIIAFFIFDQGFCLYCHYFTPSKV